MLFYGPPGTGKTMVARELARKSVCILFNICLLLQKLLFKTPKWTVESQAYRMVVANFHDCI